MHQREISENFSQCSVFVHVFQKHKGRFLHADIPEIWQDYSEELRPWLLRLTEDFDLTFPLPKEPVNVVPCLLPGEQPEDVSPFIIFLSHPPPPFLLMGGASYRRF